MVGELSPDGNFVWNGTAWEPNTATSVQPVSQNVFQLEPQNNGEIDWNPVLEKSEKGGKAKIVAMSIVGLLLVSITSWLLYAFVIDGMLFPDDLTKDEFIKIVENEDGIEELYSGETDDWRCLIEYTLEDEFDGDSLTLKTKLEYYASKDSARAKTELQIYFSKYSNDIWIDDKQIAWHIDDDCGSDDCEIEIGKIAIEGVNSTPAKELFTNDSAGIDWCFIHQSVAENLTNNPSQSFRSEGERFPDEDGERAVKIETKQLIDGEDEEYTISIYFDEENKILGSKITNSTFDCLVITSSKSNSEPDWVKDAATDTPMMLSVGSGWMYKGNYTTTLYTQYNATYALDGVDVVLYSKVYDEDYNYTLEVNYSVDIETAINGGGVFNHVDPYYGEANCTLSYNDTGMVGISTGDTISMSCDNYDWFSGFSLGLANSNGVAEEKSLSVPWVSPMFTIIALLGAALIVSKRE
tara:strand:- start:181 stop:1581 length:1401 start_codon:yes stop_codon:yes gene_type:complete